MGHDRRSAPGDNPRPDLVAPRRGRRRALLCVAALALPALGCESVALGDIGPELSDDRPLSEAVRDALARSPETMNQSILVKTLDDDLVRLSGLVDTEATRQTAEQVAQRVSGVRSVVNTLKIRY